MTLDTKSFDLHRTLPLSPDRLFTVLTDAAHREKWAAPDADTALITETTDLRVGGQDRHRAGPADAPDFAVETRWYDLAGPDRAVFTETLIFGGEAVSTSLVTYHLEGAGRQTKLSMTIAVSSFSGPDTLAEIKQGWDGGLENLEHYAKGMAG